MREDSITQAVTIARGIRVNWKIMKEAETKMENTEQGAPRHRAFQNYSRCYNVDFADFDLW